MLAADDRGPGGGPHASPHGRQRRVARRGGAAHAGLLAERGAHAAVHSAHRAAARRQGQGAHRGDQVGYLTSTPLGFVLVE